MTPDEELRLAAEALRVAPLTPDGMHHHTCGCGLRPVFMDNGEECRGQAIRAEVADWLDAEVRAHRFAWDELGETPELSPHALAVARAVIGFVGSR